MQFHTKRQTIHTIGQTLILCSLLLFWVSSGAAAVEKQWQPLGQGLDLMEYSQQELLAYGVPTTLPPADAGNSQPELIVLRLNPVYYEFTLHMASEDGAQSSMQSLAAKHGLYAAINAGMYLPDRRTGIGLLRSPTHTNNPRIATRLGGFFVAGPKREGLPGADILERGDGGEALEKRLNDYAIAAQNYRLISSYGRPLWPEGGSMHSIAALGKDRKGNILFILCRLPVAIADFSSLLLRLPLDVSLAIYLDGGAEAGLLLNAVPKQDLQIWRGRFGNWGISAGTTAPLPNLIGARPKTP